MGRRHLSNAKVRFFRITTKNRLSKKYIFDGLTPVRNGVPLAGEHRTFCRFAPALTLFATDHATSLIALNATALDALTSLPRKARREPIYAYVYEESLLACDIDTPPLGYA